MPLILYQSILAGLESQLLTACQIRLDKTGQADPRAALGPARGRRVIFGLAAEGGPGLLILTFSEGVCREMVVRLWGGETIDYTEEQVNACLIEFSTELIRKVRPSRPNDPDPPMVVLRAASALAIAGSSAAVGSELRTSAGTVSAAFVPNTPRARSPRDAKTALAACHAEAAPRNTRVADLRGSGPDRVQQVLVVDDDVESSHLLAKCLSDLGLRVHEARGGQAALNALKITEIDLVLLEYEMSGMNGLECLRRIRAGRSQPRVIMVTASKSPQVIKTATALGISAYIIKPYSVEDVKNRVSRLLLGEPVAST